MSPTHEQDPSVDVLDPLPGRVIAGNFRIEKLIGAGAMGNVYRAEQVSLSKAVAVKVLHPHLMSDPKLVERFKREAKSASLLDHPNSIRIIDSGQDADGTLYIAMELLDGRDLSQVIRDELPLPLPRVVRIVGQVLAALDEAHARGLIHRDLKPSNIMLVDRRDEPDFVKVCDYGIAKATAVDEDRAAMLTVQGLICGTPEYMAPEQARAESVDGRADLYSTAVILYQMVTGDIPFRADSAMGIVSRHLSEPPVPPSRRRPDLSIPKEVDDIVLRGMEKDRERRFETALAFRAALEALLALPRRPSAASLRASMPTARDLEGSGGWTRGPGSTGRIAAPPEPRGATTHLTGPRGRRSRVTSMVGLALGVLVAAGGAAIALRPRMAARAPTAGAASPLGVTPATAPAAITPIVEPGVAPEPLPSAKLEEAPRPPVRETTRRRSGREGTASPGSAAAARPVGAAPLPTAPLLPAAAAAPPPALPIPEPPPRTAADALAEAERLLAEGEVTEACQRGEEAKRLGGKLAAVHKFLGKCYMRAGRTREASENYSRYLELAPNAPDAPFVKSMLK